jgi:transposase
LHVPPTLRGALEPLLEVIAELSRRIRAFEGQIRAVVAASYPEAVALQQPQGVGALTALAFVLLLEEPRRFARSRDVGWPCCSTDCGSARRATIRTGC